MIKQENKTEFLGQLIDVVEDWLEEKGIDIPNEEKDELDAAIIYGSDYDKLQSEFNSIMESYHVFDQCISGKIQEDVNLNKIKGEKENDRKNN